MENLYTKEGRIEARNRIVLNVDEMQIISPSHEQLIDAGWELYVEPAPTIDDIKDAKIREIIAHDTSGEVNSFILNGNPVWLSKADRVGLMNSINIEKASGRETSILWFGGVKLEINCDTAIQLLSALELYALECYNITASHKASVLALESIEEINAYDYTIGYPEKLAINI